jgi:hypothetical protein
LVAFAIAIGRSAAWPVPIFSIGFEYQSRANKEVRGPTADLDLLFEFDLIFRQYLAHSLFERRFSLIAAIACYAAKASRPALCSLAQNTAIDASELDSAASAFP